MNGFFVILFLFLALLAGFLVGWALIQVFRPDRRRSHILGLFGLAILLGTATVVVYFTALGGRGAPGGLSGSPVAARAPWEEYQFEIDAIQIPRAAADEPTRTSVSFPAALSYLEEGAEVWNRKYKCIGCHVNGSYLLFRPALSRLAGVPPASTRDFFLQSLKPFLEKKEEILLLSGNKSAQVVWAAAGLASWDLSVTGTLSPDTDDLLRCMFRLQRENGEWLVPSCWPPLQSDGYQLATVAALAAGTAPGWLENLKDTEVTSQVARLTAYLKKTVPPHDYARVWLLWASTKFPGILEPGPRTAIIESIWKLQHGNGGWALRDFAAPRAWGAGSRGDQLEAEADYSSAASEAHMTGLAVCVLREAGVPASDPRIQEAVSWILKNQRRSGRWWSASLNTQTYHFLTYSATCLALAALEKCGRFPAQSAENRPRRSSN
jgi:squalene-hopene/tetraprenyl-beta-curcumene cyclase